MITPLKMIAGDEPIDAGKVNLSGGEKSRVALANVLAQPNNALLLDEPANHLDTATRDELLHAPGDYDGRIICAGHEPATIGQIATHLYMVENGEITLTDVKDQAKCLRYSRPRYSGLTDSIGFTVTLWRGTSPVLMNWCRTPPGTRTASPALTGYSFPAHTRMPAPSVMNAWCSHSCTWSGLDSPGPCFTYSITYDETPSCGPSRGLEFPCSLRITGSI